MPTSSRRGLLTEDATKNIADNISYSTDKSVFSDADLIIESIVEEMEMKQTFWGEVELIAEKMLFLQRIPLVWHKRDQLKDKK
ncbi:hypothetical protein MASR2M79_24980 [Aminivibrio sp.]